MRIQVGDSSFLVKLGDTTHVRVTIDPGANNKRGMLVEISSPRQEGLKPTMIIDKHHKTDKIPTKNRLANIENRIKAIELNLMNKCEHEWDSTNLVDKIIERLKSPAISNEFESRIERSLERRLKKEIQIIPQEVSRLLIFRLNRNK